MRPRGRTAVAGTLLLAVAYVVVRFWWHNTHTGTSYDDARDGECIESVTFIAVQQMQTGTYTRTPVVNCDNPNANYIIVAHTTELRAIQCPDGDKDVSMAARIKMQSDNGRRVRTNYDFGWMCAAPLLHVDRCYSPHNDRGMGVRPTECDVWSWQVTRRIDDASDIHQCSPATGLVLTAPKVTYCEILAPLPPELRDNRLAQRLQRTQPPAG